jgi:hypothetical protein
MNFSPQGAPEQFASQPEFRRFGADRRYVFSSTVSQSPTIVGDGATLVCRRGNRTGALMRIGSAVNGAIK